MMGIFREYSTWAQMLPPPVRISCNYDMSLGNVQKHVIVFSYTEPAGMPKTTLLRELLLIVFLRLLFSSSTWLAFWQEGPPLYK